MGRGVGAELEAHAAAVVVGEPVGVAKAPASIGAHRAELAPGQADCAELELHVLALSWDPGIAGEDPAAEEDRAPADFGDG